MPRPTWAEASILWLRLAVVFRRGRRAHAGSRLLAVGDL